MFRWLPLLIIPSTAAWAQPASDQTEMIKTLLAKVEQLERRVALLEGQKQESAREPATPAVRPAPPSAEEAAAAIHAEHEAPPPAGLTIPTMALRGFTDLNFGGTNQPGTKTGFNEGQFILHIASALSNRVSYFGEISFTARNDAGLGSPRTTGFDAEIERSIIRYDFSDYLKVSFGRYHTPINYWNTAYHHGQWLQTSISRPEMTRFGGSFIPVHFIGGLVEGALPAGGLNFNYNAGAGNGRSTVLNRGGDFGDVNNHKAWLANAFIKPDRIEGLQIGGSVYRDKTALVRTTGPGDFLETITSAHVVYLGRGPELIAEIANARHERATASRGAANSLAWYGQIGYRLPVMNRLWKPYYRFESIRVPLGDEMFRGFVDGLHGSTVGLRYDFSSFAAMKFEFRSITRPGLQRFNGGFVQTSFTF